MSEVLSVLIATPSAPAVLASASDATCTDLDLVLAIDASASMGEAEFALQAAGYAAALRSAQVQRAIRSAGDGDRQARAVAP